ncbi:MAG: rod shape-determining protein [Clostridia bacterium]|nr:rod shape-determining protein [Clostridia bacterium]
MLKSGVAEVPRIDNIMATAHGLELPIEAPETALVVNMGGGVSEIALISLCGTIAGCSITVAGAMLDRALMDFITGKYGVKIGVATARKVREEIGSLYYNDSSSMEVSGISINTLTPKTVRIYATDTYEALLPYFARIAESLTGNTNLCPPELAESLYENGVYIAGGLSKTPGLKQVLEEITKLPVTIAPDGELTAIIGAGKLIEDKPLLKKIIAQQ